VPRLYILVLGGGAPRHGRVPGPATPIGRVEGPRHALGSPYKVLSLTASKALVFPLGPMPSSGLVVVVPCYPDNWRLMYTDKHQFFIYTQVSG